MLFDMRYQRSDRGHERIATLDIETTHYDAAQGEVVSIGIGVHDRGRPASEATYKLNHRESENDEADLIADSLERLDNLGADLLVTYNGTEFDLEFLNNRRDLLGKSKISPTIDTTDTHLDLFVDRRDEADRIGEKWPGLEECLTAYDLPEPVTIWNGKQVTNTLFGEEVGPAYLDTITNGTPEQITTLQETINHYLTTDLEANLALYYSDIGVEFTPDRLGSRSEF